MHGICSSNPSHAVLLPPGLQALSDKEGLKQKLSSALGGESGKAAAEAAPAEAAPAAAAEAAPAAAAEAAPAAAAEAKA